MDDRVVDFIRGLRAAGVRVSLAESVDALRAVEVLGVSQKGTFRESLRATLVKEHDDFAAFDQLFPLYFGSGGPVMQNAMDDLSGDEQEMLKAALAAMSGRLDQLMDWLTSGNGPSKEELEELANRAGAQWANNPGDARWVSRRMLQQMGMGHLEEQIRQLIQKLQEMGMSQEAIEKLTGVIQANREALAEQVAQQVGLQIAQDRANRPEDLHGSDLMHKPFGSLTEDETNILRQEVQRLVAELRSRIALRRKRGKEGKFDAKATIRANQRYGGVPVEIKHRKNKLKPRLVLLCDTSRSMLQVAEFMLRLTYELQDQVAKTRSFGFYADMQEISIIMSGNRPGEAVQEALESFYKYGVGHYATDFGHSLDTFFKKWLDSVDGRTTVVILGDGRNNYNSPRIDLMKDLQRRAKRLVWLNPEHPRQWGTGDSDMLEYVPICDGVHTVRNLAQLSTAVDKLLDVR
ncbi:MAG: VWA domain-containing protein [Anaerolineales bacterium]|nr:VWA domain-containing protein [Anaerolineales bacterium]